uniref:Neurexin IV-like protein n=1 Tax=Parasacculina yatsui TaxID=2836420 RepID=A0A8K1RBX1_9CRUS|nr:neurexin IV-like protein [Parasacculina yatsui]
MNVQMSVWIRFLLVLCALISIEADRCSNPLMEGAKLTASTERIGKEARFARLNGNGAWTARVANTDQYITVDLQTVYAVRRVATQGRALSTDFVSAYQLQYGRNGRDFSDYYGPRGGVWDFAGNSDGDSVVENELEVPIVARYIRFRPTNWQSRIAMRIEVYGCLYSASRLGFAGNTVIEQDFEKRPLHSLSDRVEFRFRTVYTDAVLLYGRGSQGDLIAVQLIQNKLHLKLSLGSLETTSLSVGSLLDDNLWHDVIIDRDRRQLSLTVDRVNISTLISGDFRKLDLNNKLYVGGVAHQHVALDVFANFSGCMEDLYFNDIEILADLKRDGISLHGKPSERACSAADQLSNAVTFTSQRSYLQYEGGSDLSQMNTSFGFRTFEPDGLMMYHNFKSRGFIKVYLDSGLLTIQLDGEQVSQPVVLTPFAERQFNDGAWHGLSIVLATNQVLTLVDGYQVVTRRLFSFTSGETFLFGGGLVATSDVGYIGCMRDMMSDGFKRGVSARQYETAQYASEIVHDSCHLVDRCYPSPCEHGGRCWQDMKRFHCDCSGTGYGGSVCHTAIHPVSCTKLFEQRPQQQQTGVHALLDVDGSGPLPAFPVLCVGTSDGRVETHVSHDLRGDETVDGFQKPGSFIRDIEYPASFEQLEVLINSSIACRQNLLYTCRGARLLNTATSRTEPFRPLSWWMSRSNAVMDYWGGSQPGSRKCRCGIDGNCVDRALDCNCDAGISDEDHIDGGDLIYKDDLPVRQLRFGDTGSLSDDKLGRYRLGDLICVGDALSDDTVTFRKADATFNMPTIELGYTGDIFFEFRTALTSGTFFHITGPEDYMMVFLDGNSVKLRMSISGVEVPVQVASAFRLDDNEWHSVMIEVNRLEVSVLLDNSLSASTPISVSARPLHFTSKLVIGAQTSYEYGFAGCMRAFSVNGRLLSLRVLAERGLYGVSPGCVGKCASSPCLNNGQCHEMYSSFTCNCRFTAYKGPICADEIGVGMNRDYMISYDMGGNYRSTVNENIVIGFSTTSPSGFLMGLIGLTNEYMTVEVSNSGRIRVVFDFGFERQEVVYPSTGDRVFKGGQFHMLRVRRDNNGQTLHVQVDHYEELVERFNVSRFSDIQFDSIRKLYIGKNESMTEGFLGCISRVQFDDIFPLKEMFQENRPDYVTGNRDSIHEDFCGVEPQRLAEEDTESRPPPEVDEAIIRSLYNHVDSAMIGGVVSVLLLVVILAVILLCHYTARHKGDYLTREDSGADIAMDADEAVAMGYTGPHVEKMKEFFI